MKFGPKLLLRHKQMRLQYYKKNMAMGDNWKKVIFSDEKRFNLIDPDGLKYLWRELLKETKSTFSRNFRGGSLMIWAAIAYDGKSEIVFLNSLQDSFDYSLVLENSLLPFAWQYYGLDYIFLQDNASIRISNEMKGWFDEQNIVILDHPPISPHRKGLGTACSNGFCKWDAVRFS